MKTTVSLNRMYFKANHGFYEKERIEGNEFYLDVSVELKSFDRIDDNINDTVNYEDIYKICNEEMLKTSKLIETVVYRITTRIKDELDHVTGGEVSIFKVKPSIGGPLDHAQVKMEF